MEQHKQGTASEQALNGMFAGMLSKASNTRPGSQQQTPEVELTFCGC
jgi:hypothetical protein